MKKLNYLFALMLAIPFAQAELLTDDPGEAFKDKEIRRERTKDYKGNPDNDERIQKQEDRVQSTTDAQDKKDDQKILGDDDFRVED